MIDEPKKWASVREACGLNTRRPAQLHEQFIDEHRLTLCVVLVRRGQVEREQARGVPARIHTCEPAEAIDQQPRPDKQHSRRCHLTGHEQIAKAGVVTYAARRPYTHRLNVIGS